MSPGRSDHRTSSVGEGLQRLMHADPEVVRQEPAAQEGERSKPEGQACNLIQASS